MSTTYHLECDICKESIWIGQRDYIYSGEAEIMDALEKFLYRHRSSGFEHHLFFRADNASRYMDGEDGWTRVKTNEGDLTTHAEVEYEPAASPPARKHSGHGKQASGLASKLDWIAVSKEAFEKPWYEKVIGVGDEGDGETKLETQKATALSLFVSGVTEGLNNCSVYFDFDFRVGSFSSGVLAFFNYGPGWYNSNYVTSHMSYGLDRVAMQREVDNVIRAISTELGQRVFTGAIEPIPDKFLKMVKRVNK